MLTQKLLKEERCGPTSTDAREQNKRRTGQTRLCVKLHVVKGIQF
jgi:hypothetical protein